ncbi:carbon-nitrogen hydrolase family protein [Arthrobacter woluwensis]|uniref:carbon-nitrogen hydrolase family protein n=1 Tax=Arthrobacter woluwensis TaxID=156980 RepID=UPI001AAEF264|nr:carbon-nitrogen hydrolase family protein [Arthrobacter woluwensis]
MTKTVGLLATPVDPRIQNRSSDARRMPEATLRVAVAQPAIRLSDLKANVASHVDAIRAADSRIVIFPELSLTGYDLEAPAVELDDPLLKDLVDVCADAGSVALIGAPVGESDRLSIATLRVDADGVSVAYRTTWLHGEESTRFTPGSGPSTIDVDGWVVGLAICRDTGQSQHTAQMARQGVDLYAAGVVDVAADVVECQARAFVISRALAAPVAIASFAGPTGGGFDETAGHSAVFAADGTKLAEADGRPGGMARAELTRRTR